MNREKQIEEMAQIIAKNIYGAEQNADFAPNAKNASKELYAIGYHKQSEWISVKDRLPDEQGHFLIVNEEGKIITAFYTPRFGWFSGVRVRNITHWMPLPEAPKGGAG